jgi:hypothetical protein
MMLACPLSLAFSYMLLMGMSCLLELHGFAFAWSQMTIEKQAAVADWLRG